MTPRKKLFLETAKLSNINSGLGQFCFHLGSAVSKFNEEFDLTYFVPKGQAEIFGSSHHYITTSRWKRIAGVSAKADVWHCFHQGSPYWPRQKRTKVVLTVHDLNFTIKYSGWKKTKEQAVIQRHVEKADAIVAISDFTRNEILKHLSVDPKKITVVYNGVVMPQVKEQKPDYVRGEKFFFSVGIISAKKNFHVLLPMLKKLEGTLIIAGNNTSTYARQIIDQASRLGLSDRVILPGEISDAEKLWLYKNCEAFFFPSLAEGFGLPVIEAMSQGKPVFCSNLTSLPEIGGPHAYFFENFSPDEMAQMVHSGLKEYADHPMKAAAIKEWANRFSWEAAAQKYLRIYASLADQIDQ